MAIKYKSIQYEEFQSLDDVPSLERQLVEFARDAMAKAYAPYSKFQVGAAVRLDDGTEEGLIITGNNQENAAYPLGLCAERVALLSAKSQYPDYDVTHLAIIAAPEGEESYHVIPPCGSCRQVIAETEERNTDYHNIKFIFASTHGQVFIMDGSEKLLPFAFSSDNLEKQS